ncbi:hypothetical protein YC2023_075054 [Brassica napus]
MTGIDTGCYNFDCPGFVPINQHFAVGAAAQSVSTLDGRQEQFPATIWMVDIIRAIFIICGDPHSGHWWLKFSTNLAIGYWPSTLFTHLQNGATEVQWGEEIANKKDQPQHTTTKMGRGNFAQEGWRKASYFRNLEIIDEGEITRPPFGTVAFALTRISIMLVFLCMITLGLQRISYLANIDKMKLQTLHRNIIL